MLRRSATPVLTRREEIEALCAAIREAGLFGFDTEFINEAPAPLKLCLVQVATPDRVALVDPLSGADPSPLWNLVADATVTTVVHAGQEDLAMVYASTGCVPRNIFDVQIAAGLAGLHYPLSLARLVSEVLRVHLPKTQTRTDWSRRPLTGAQRRYAVEDVAHLPELYRRLVRRLRRRGREAWAAEEMRRFEDPRLYRPASEEAYLRIRGARSLDREGLAILRAVALCRQELAERQGRRPGTVIRDDLLLEVARHRLDTPEKIGQLRGAPRSPSLLRSLAEAVAAARRLDPSERPPLPVIEERTPEEAVLVDVLAAVARAHCLEHDVAYGLVCTRRDLQVFVDRCRGVSRGRSEPLLLKGWRREFIAGVLEDVLAGRRALRITGLPDHPRLVAEAFEAPPT